MPIALQGQARRLGTSSSPGSTPIVRSTRPTAVFSDCLPGRFAAGLANARAYQEERRRAEALAAIDRAKTAFFSNVSHEFRTPLTLMLGPTEDALSGDGVDAARADLETVYRNELRLLKLVNSLLDFSRAEAGRDAGALRADRSRRADGRPGEHVPIGDRARRAQVRRRVRAAAGAGLRRSADVGEDRPQPALERVQVHVRGRDPGRAGAGRGHGAR